MGSILKNKVFWYGMAAGLGVYALAVYIQNRQAEAALTETPGE